MAGDMAGIGRNLKALRERIGLNQAHVAEYLGVDQSFISKVESGERVITTDMLENLARLFCCPVSSLGLPPEELPSIGFAFRTSALGKEDLFSLAAVHRIVLNQMEMEEISKRMLHD